MRHDHVVERELQQGAERRESARLMRRRGPDTKVAAFRCGQCVGEDQSALLREPQRRLVTAAAVVHGHESTRELAPGFDGLEFRLGNVVAPKEPRSEGAGAVAPHEDVEVPDMVGLQRDDLRRRASVEPFPDLIRVIGRRHGIE
jgi:hypothetical protein